MSTRFGRCQKVNLSTCLRDRMWASRRSASGIWLVPCMTYDLGYCDAERCRLGPIDDPFGPKVLPMSPAPSVRIVVARLLG